MDRRTRLKTFGLILLTALAVCVLLPSFAGDALPSGFRKVFSKKISLGIDIDGGSYLMYDINLDKAVDDKALEMKRDLKLRIDRTAKGKGSVTAPSTPIGAVVAVLDDPTQVKAIKDGFLKDYGDQVVSFACPQDAPAGRSICVKVDPDYAQSVRDDAIKQAVITISDRINQKGVGGTTVVEKGDQIIVELPGADAAKTEKTKSLIERTAKLEFKLVDEPLADGNTSNFMTDVVGIANKAKAADASVTPAVQAFVKKYDVKGVQSIRQHRRTGKKFAYAYLEAPNRTTALSAEEIKGWRCNTDSLEDERKLQENGGECSVQGRQVIEKFLELVAQEQKVTANGVQKPLSIDDDHEVGYEEIKETEDGEVVWQGWYLKREAEVTGAQLTDVQQSFDAQSSKPVVVIKMNRVAAERWGDITAANTGARFAIIMDDKIQSAPSISEAIRGGTSQIEMGAGGSEGVKEAKDMAVALKSGSLPAPLVLENESLRGPSLGHDAVSKAQVSFLIGAGLVLVIMVFYYRTSGAISIMALILNITFMLAVLVQFEASLTLPGIAALVLTVGMAVDANIIVYERIREELRLGKSVRGAVDAGFKHGFSAILDGQLTTAVAAWVLLQYTSEDAIRGFSVMLLIGIGCTLFTAYWCTKLFFEHYIGRKKDAEIGI